MDHQQGRDEMPDPLRIEPADAKARVDAGEAIVLDVVSPMAWEQIDRAVHGAVRISPDEVGDRWQELPHERAIIAYCT
jgi:rhodanese-related sulfurtransferase